MREKGRNRGRGKENRATVGIRNGKRKEEMAQDPQRGDDGG